MNQSIDEIYKKLINRLSSIECSIANKSLKLKSKKLSDRTIDLLSRRKSFAELARKPDALLKLRVEFAELSKITRKTMEFDLSEYNRKLRLNAIFENKCLKRANKNLLFHKKFPAISSDNIQTFYSELYDGKKLMLQNQSIPVLPFLNEEIKEVVLSSNGYGAKGPDGDNLRLI